MEIVYIDPKDHDASGLAAYTPLGRSADPRVHKDGVHDVVPKVQIGPRSGDDHAAYTPIGSSHGPLVHAGEKHEVAPTVAIALERNGSGYDSRPAASSSSHGVEPTPASSVAATPVAALPPSAPKPAAVAKPAASPTPLAGLNLSTGPAASPPSARISVPLDEDADELETVAGRIENIAGRSMLLETVAGKSRVRVADGARIDRDTLGSPSDLKPGLFVGVLHAPGGPAVSLRIYPVGPSMPRPGVVPMHGSRVGQVTTFGSVVALQFGGLVVNAGGATTTITLPNAVEILKPASSAASEFVAGAQVIATGPVTGDGTLVATGVRVTSPPRPER
jgi:hypothetical protein